MQLYQLESNAIRLEYTPESLQLAVYLYGQMRVWQSESYIQDKSGTKFYLKNAKCTSEAYESGVSRGVKAVYSGFGKMDVSLHTLVELMGTGEIRISFHLENEPMDGIRSVAYPPAFSFGAKCGKGYTILPRMQGVMIPAQYEKALIPSVCEQPLDGDTYVGVVYEREAYMPIFGQTIESVGYIAIFDTPFDAQYLMRHSAGGDTLLAPRFIASLGSMRYPRCMLYRFDNNMDYNLMAKTYRKYLKERGRLVTLDMKIAENPKVERMIGVPIVNAGIATHISPLSQYYKNDAPERNDCFTSFVTRSNQLRELKKKGIEEVYLHLDGWGHHGYDNLHPSPFPVNEAAGGANAMRALADTCHELGYTFAVHDQYRDYYHDAPDFDFAHAIQLENGEHPYCSIWFGGPHSFLCAKNAPDYVRRNYDEFARLGINIDGAYLDVFSVVALDECFSPDHPMTREECCINRSNCLRILTERGIVPSSEEAVDAILPVLPLCHHAPYYTDDFKSTELFGYPIPLLNLVWHDCVIIPWAAFTENGFGLPIGYDPYGLMLINGGAVICSIEENVEHFSKLKTALDLHRRIARQELIRHEIVEGNPKHQKSYFADGTITEADFEKNIFKINGQVVG